MGKGKKVEKRKAKSFLKRKKISERLNLRTVSALG
jgi:hypothetical protein